MSLRFVCELALALWSAKAQHFLPFQPGGLPHPRFLGRRWGRDEAQRSQRSLARLASCVFRLR